MKIVKKIALAFTLVIVGLLLTYNMYRFICTNILKKDITTINGYAVLEVISGSMEPTIHIGDMIVIDTKVEEYKKNDIITFYDDEGSFVTHRIISINSKEVVTKGDNNNKKDEPTPLNKIVGRYVFKINNGQKVVSLLKSPIIAFLILGNGILLCIFMSIDKYGNLKLDEEEKEYEEFKEYLNKKRIKKGE